MSSKRLRDEDIESFLAIPSGSEDCEDFSEAGSDEDMEKIRSAVSFFSESLSDVEPLLSPQRHHSLSPANVPLASEQQSSNPQPSTSGETSPKCSGAKRQIRITRRSSTSKRKFIWKKKTFQSTNPQFTGNSNLQPPITEFETPLQYFSWFFDDELLGHIVEEMQKLSIQKNSSKPFKITVVELKKFLGVCLIMSLAPLPNIRMYWAPELGIPLIMETMPLNHFKKICQFLHFNDNTTQPTPMLETLKKKCQSISKREALSVDEQMCATKAANFLRQYLPNKPHKWGYKLLVLCDDRGFAYDFEIYSGMENDPELRHPDEPDLGASSNIVVRLARSVPNNQQYKLFFDNYYTSPELISYLAKHGIQSLGTVNKGRFSEEWVANVDGTDIVTVMWYDNKPVVLSSFFVGQEPIQSVRRYCKKKKKYIQHMAGVDLLDSFLGKYKIKIRTRKWYLRLFYHLLDVIVINSWLLYRRVGEQQQTPTPMTLKDFKFVIGIRKTFIFCEKCRVELCLNKDNNCFKSFHQ
ncbi:hypothetical protein ABMA27_009088 [Loxostege sticticalis]|uniref:PiggyBac transposable element-derived protein domain-containing protein n=1 Tax=Loxostege sticticalis TaxID=481309 RepID=A0ABR3H9W2_LOXSC